MTHEHGALLIFDEVITGMRVAAGGAQERFGVEADITILSKALGGGYPISALGSTREIMQSIVEGQLVPRRRLFRQCPGDGGRRRRARLKSTRQASRFTTIWMRLRPNLPRAFDEIFTRLGIPHQVHQVGPMVSMLLTHRRRGSVTSYRDMRRHCDFEKYIRFQHQLQRSGVYFHPNQFEPLFFSTAHTQQDVATALERIEDGARAALWPEPWTCRR